MTIRDRSVLMVVALLAVLAATWLTVLSPKRKETARVGDQVTAERQRLDDATRSAADAEAARERYARDYATVARLGKAVPVQDDVPSLVYQLESTARDNHIDFRSIKLEGSPANNQPASAPPAAAVAATGSAEKGGTTPTAAPATSAAAAPLPPGATVGPAGFPIMPFTFHFDGSFFSMQHFMRQLDGFTTAEPERITVRGRLLTIDGFSLNASRKGFPKVKVSISATAYLLPADQGLTAGATPQGPVTVASTGSANASAPTPAGTASTPGGAR